MSAPTFIGLVGRAGTGKDTVRDMLERDHGYTGLAFADPIRAMLGALFDSMGESREYMTERKLKEVPIPGLGVSYRHLAQTLGTDWGRSVTQALWLRIAQASLANVRSEGALRERFVVSDVRFANEANWVREQGGQIWLITRPQAAQVRDHLSEYAQDDITPDHFIDNSGSIEQLWCQVSALVGADQ